MHSEESRISDGILEGSVIVHFVSKNVVLKYGIRDGVFGIRAISCAFFTGVRVRVRVRVRVSVRVRVRVRVRGNG